MAVGQGGGPAHPFGKGRVAGRRQPAFDPGDGILVKQPRRARRRHRARYGRWAGRACHPRSRRRAGRGCSCRHCDRPRPRSCRAGPAPRGQAPAASGYGRRICPNTIPFHAPRAAHGCARNPPACRPAPRRCGTGSDRRSGNSPARCPADGYGYPETPAAPACRPHRSPASAAWPGRGCRRRCPARPPAPRNRQRLRGRLQRIHGDDPGIDDDCFEHDHP